MKAITQNKHKFLFAVLSALLLMVLVFPTGADARIGNSSVTDEGSQGRLREAVDEEISQNTYISDTGDTIRGNDLVKNGITTTRFDELTSKEKQKLIDDMANAVSAQQERDTENNATNPVTDDTVTNWLQELQQQPGVGARLLNQITEQIKPDYVTGQKIFAPFSGPLNTAIALVVIITMTLLALTFVLDLAFINIPVVQAMILNSLGEKGGGGGGRHTNFFVGREAIGAVEDSENDSNGKSRNANGIYLKRRFIGLMLLGLCLLYLLQGQIFILVGMLMDLLGGFLE